MCVCFSPWLCACVLLVRKWQFQRADSIVKSLQKSPRHHPQISWSFLDWSGQPYKYRTWYVWLPKSFAPKFSASQVETWFWVLGIAGEEKYSCCFSKMNYKGNLINRMTIIILNLLQFYYKVEMQRKYVLVQLFNNIWRELLFDFPVHAILPLNLLSSEFVDDLIKVTLYYKFHVNISLALFFVVIFWGKHPNQTTVHPVCIHFLLYFIIRGSIFFSFLKKGFAKDGFFLYVYLRSPLEE